MALPTSHQDLDASMANAPEEIRKFVRQREFEKGQSFMPSRPKVGLLSHTVVPSPTIQWVLPAHLRNQRHNDVVFVGDRHLQIREAVSGIHLEDVTTKADFDAQIMAAKVINVSTELPWEAQMKLGSGNVSTNADPDARDDLPPQILVLSLASRELVFLYYSTSEGGRFIHYRRPLPNDVNLFEQFGRNVSVEPRSRAIAVSASCDYFGIFMLEEPHILRSQMTRNQFSPILEERFFRVDGDILSMEFLHPKSEEENRIILLLLVAKNQLTHAICYEWNANILIRNATPRVTKRLLPFEDRLPTMVIPLTKTSSFMLVATGSVSVYRNRLDPRTQPIRYPLPCDKQNQRSPLWTRWARPLRNWVYNQKHDDIYLCREDGQIFYLEIGNEGDIENQTFLGLLHCDVDAAFDTLDIGHEGGDLLLAAGTTGDGGLFVQKARDHPRCVQRFMNWTPVTDSVVVQSTGDDPLEGVSSDRLFTCSPSNYGKGSITELRYGIEAQIGLAVSLEGLSGTKDIWTITDRISGGVFILTSDPVSSLLIYLPADFGEEICAIDEADSGLGFSSQTLAASCTQSGAIIQVTERAVHLRDVSGPLSGCRFDYDPTENVVAAAVHDSAALIATAIRSSQGAKLHLLKISSTDNQLELSGIGERVNIDYDPVSISVERLGLSLFVFIGTGPGKVLIYRVVREGSTFVKELNLNLEKSDDISKAIESITVVNVTAQGSLHKSVLFCGLRSGILLSFGVTVDSASPDSDIDIKQGVFQRLGHTSVRVQSKGSTALLTCGEGFWQALCVSGETPECTLERVWITDQKNPAFYPKSISGFTTSNVVDPDADDAFNSLFCIADEQLFICTLDRSARTVPRRINLPGSATKLAYSKHLRSLIVAYSQTNLDTTSDPVKRFTRPMVEFVDPDFQDQEIDLPASDESSQPWRPHGAAGEKITCILEWTPRKGDEEYHLIVIGTSRKDQEERGRVIFLQTARNAENPSRIDCSVKYVHKFEGPVYSITPYGPFTLMVSSGRDIVPLEPKFSRTRWGRASRFSAVSPAISMTAHEPYLYMSTARESLMVLKASEDKLTLHAYDRHRHDGISHVHIGGELNLTLASSRGGTVSVLTENGVTEANKMMPAALCEAHLPLSVMKLSLGSKPSSLSSSSQVIYGNTINGTIYRFLTLNEKEWRLMRLLQNVCVKDPGICPFTSKRKRQRNPVESESVDGPPSRMHIDGDILSRLVARGADYLHKMLASEDLYDSSSPETGTVPATLEHFSVLSEDVLGTSTDHVEEAMKWLRNALHMQF